VPILPGTTHSYRSTSLGNIRNDDDFRITRHTPAFTKYIELNLTEAASKCDLLRRCESLIAEVDDAMDIIGVFYCGKGSVVERVG
jgi:hypothetical protein